MKRAKQTSESIELAAILAFSGGLMDAYSYLARGKVFANAQTGNILLFGVNLADGIRCWNCPRTLPQDLLKGASPALAPDSPYCRGGSSRCRLVHPR